MNKQTSNGFTELVKKQNVKVKPETEPEVVESDAEPKSDRQPSREGTKGFTVHLSPDAHRQLKMMAMELDTTMHDLCIDGLNTIFELNNKPPIA